MTTTQSVADTPTADFARPSLLKRAVGSRESGVLIAFLILFAIMAIAKNRTFLSYGNLSNLGVVITFYAITGIGVLFVILTGGVDLSLGSTAGLCSYIAAIAAWKTPNPYWGIFAGILAGLATGMVVGAINGGIVSFIRVTSFIVTLGMFSIARGVIYIIAKYIVAAHMLADGPKESPVPIVDIPDVYIHAGSGTLLGIPVPILVLVFVAVIAHFVLTYTVFGRRLYAIGGNEEATQLSGIHVDWVKFLAYVICSAVCAVTGILYVARYSQGALEAGKGDELNAIAAAVIGGTSLMGGSGTVLGVILGACIMGVVANGLDILGLPAEPKLAIIGTVIVIAAIVDVVRNRGSRR